ncbi:lysine N(6)-hydroxylase/L-ornithine N(5)-oxygenase family protein [Pseudalkalibacillus decolorationis]|uniref:lysine N(6)-hydroxylase/L-ornithine N(5)-oxygenase family protein n=1 Tax=Pseudalkalibacillus decolorationis TaxID=163879 RepID=UPI0021493AF8|nr:lysine N(6)-hydroxylase/L-ornithine N(5)-oxygenase family protein [Pseudalkalibacillus decolorationis]
MTGRNQEPDHIYDLIGVGIGPFNLGLAALLDEVDEVDALFFDRKNTFNWHPGMLIDGTTLQVPFFADLVSMADVRSRYSFLNYLQEHDRMYQFYFLEKFHIPRKEYNHYCQWVADQLEYCWFRISVENVRMIDQNGTSLYEVRVWNEDAGEFETYLTKDLAIGIGSSPTVPEWMKPHLGDTVFHSADYLNRKNTCMNADSITVIGSGQSAAEVFYDLAKEQEEREYSLNWYTRSQGFFPMEYSKLGLEYFSPDFTDFFYELPQFKKDGLIKQQDLLYKGISAETIADIYDLLYERSIGGEKPAIRLQAMMELSKMEQKVNAWGLDFTHTVTEDTVSDSSDIVILGTGYNSTVPEFLAGLEDVIDWDVQGRYQVSRDYRLQMKQESRNEIFVQNGELHTHGVGAPDLGLGANRNAVIINQLAGSEIYPVRSKNVFQTFGGMKKGLRELARV